MYSARVWGMNVKTNSEIQTSSTKFRGQTHKQEFGSTF